MNRDIYENSNQDGAGDGNRTHVASLEGWNFTIKLHPPGAAWARKNTFISAHNKRANHNSRGWLVNLTAK
jgi:hypothetical protein